MGVGRGRFGEPITQKLPAHPPSLTASFSKCLLPPPPLQQEGVVMTLFGPVTQSLLARGVCFPSASETHWVSGAAEGICDGQKCSRCLAGRRQPCTHSGRERQRQHTVDLWPASHHGTLPCRAVRNPGLPPHHMTRKGPSTPDTSVCRARVRGVPIPEPPYTKATKSRPDINWDLPFPLARAKQLLWALVASEGRMRVAVCMLGG